MASIDFENVTLEIPIHNPRNSVLRHQFRDFGLGGRMKVKKRVVQHITALREVSFSLPAGARLAVMGLNGSGKTTLLRTIAGICCPTTGDARVEGDVFAMFSKNAGLNPELSGVDNVIQMGLLRGLRREDVERALPDIADFTELGHYLDLPVYTYSGGMRLRLGLSLVNMLHPQILLLDEVLGGGDRRFIEKARRAGNDIYARADIVVVTSHARSTLENLASLGLVLHQGEAKFFGALDDALKCYDELVEAKT